MYNALAAFESWFEISEAVHMSILTWNAQQCQGVYDEQPQVGFVKVHL